MNAKVLSLGLILSFMLCNGNLAAQETDMMHDYESKQDSRSVDEVFRKNRSYINIGYVHQKMKAAAYPDYKWRSNWGAGFSWGRTYYLHKHPLKKMKFGIDATFIKFRCVEYKPAQLPGSTVNDEEQDTQNDYQFDAGIEVGPSLTIVPTGKLKINVYGRFSPSYSVFLISEESKGAFTPYITFGGAISYKVISLGVQGIWGSTKVRHPALLDISDWQERTKLKTTAVEFYISFKFK